MKSVIKLGFVLLLSTLITNVFAQQGGGGMRNQDPDAQAKQQLEQLKGIVKIDKKEEAKVLEIFLKSAKERQKAFQEMQQSGDRGGMREMMQTMNKKRDEELKKLLGEKRMAKYLKEIEKLREQRGNRQRRF